MDGEQREGRWRDMTLHLTPNETQALGQALESYISELRMEIAGTDSWDFRQALKERKTTLNHVLEQVRTKAS
jgi:hypothetical protein